MKTTLEKEPETVKMEREGQKSTWVSIGDSTRFEYDIENRLTSVVKRDTLIEYKYDALGRRMAKVINGKATDYRYVGDDLFMEMQKDESGNDSITASYTFGPGIDRPLQMNRGGNNFYYQADGLGSISALTDESGNVAQEYGYSVFGKIVSQSGNIENPFTYTAREYDPETGNYYCRERYYDPYAGRFLIEDPIVFLAGDANLYRYVANNALNYRDPQGLIGPAAIAVAAVVGVSVVPAAKGVYDAAKVFQNAQTAQTQAADALNNMINNKPAEAIAGEEGAKLQSQYNQAVSDSYAAGADMAIKLKAFLEALPQSVADAYRAALETGLVEASKLLGEDKKACP